ncbi:hydroxyacid dehydrogenase [Rhodopseudomonas palustris]|uniref:Hydroxyacid dehydrogenase n=2 Tax=Nitrobacteraceae TaxID=41294 RepID=A0A0D7EER7_RHOPL|nr:hydroxyacid dehydrogenase [Rhodopseudomonas palustris]
MAFTVVSLGGPVAPEGEEMLRAAGVTSLHTGPYPAKAEALDLLGRVSADAIIVRNVERIDAELMKASPNLKVVAKHGAGTNDIDLAAAKALNLPVLAAVGANSHSVAEHAFMLMLALIKDLRNQDAYVRGGGWDKKNYRGRELRGRVLGLVGIGMIGRALAAMVQPIGMTTIAYDPFAPAEAFGPHARRVETLDALLAEADVVSLHCPLTPKTQNLIDARAFGLMKPGALLINTARGEVVNEPALIEALKSGQIAAAGLDSFAVEPPAADNPLWALPNVIATPHCGGVTEEARREVSLITVRNVLALLGGSAVDPHYIVNR